MPRFSKEWFDEYQARQRAKEQTVLDSDQHQGPAVHPNAPHGSHDREYKLHREILNYCEDRGWIALHGSMVHATYRTIGEADFCCVLPNAVTLFVECKRKGQKLRPDQAAFAAWLQKLGHVLYVVTSLEQFIAAASQEVKRQGKNFRVGTDGKPC